MRLELHLSMGGAAFDNGPGPLEVSRIMRAVGDRLEQEPWDAEVPIRLNDVNGNRVGFLVMTENDGGCGDPDCSCPECPTGRGNDQA